MEPDKRDRYKVKPTSSGLSAKDRDISKSRLTSRRVFLKSAAATGAVAAMYAVPRFSSFGPKPAYAAITGLTPCLSSIDFDTIGGLVAGSRIGTFKKDGFALPSGLQPWSAFGVNVETLLRGQLNFHHHGAMIFDSANPTGGDADLKTPNPLGHPTNVTAQQNILIVSEDGITSNPDDDAGGGVIVFQFDTPRIVNSIEMIDIDDGNTTLQTRIRTYDAVADLAAPGFTFGEPPAANLLSSTNVPDVGNNSWQNVPIAQSGVRELRIRFKSSGAIARIDFDCV